MSHVVSSTKGGPITNLACLKRAVAKFSKLHWREGQKTHRWYGTWVKDYHGDDAAYKNGIDPKQFGHCEHAIRVEGCTYEIGVVKRIDGTGYALVWDFYGQGRRINEAIGDGAEHLMTAYHEEFLQDYAEEKGSTLHREETATEVYMEMEIL